MAAKVISNRRALSKCAFCRMKKCKCLPINRNWASGEKCEACERGGQPCGPMERSRPHTYQKAGDDPRKIHLQAVDVGGQLRLASFDVGAALLGSDAPVLGMSPNSGSRDLSPVQTPCQPDGASTEVSMTIPFEGQLETEVLHAVYKSTPVSSDSPTRLFRLDAGDMSDPIQGGFIARKHSESYEALSWTWDSSENTSDIELLHHGGKSIIQVRSSLKAALQRLRYEDKPRYLWIDALCIDQSSLLEKGIVIPKMNEIFGNAEQVVLWLGEEDESTCSAIRFCEQILDLDNLDRLVEDPEHVDDWHSLSRLLHKPWFNRPWVVQEIAFSRNATLLCGRASITWKTFADAVLLFSTQVQKLEQLFRRSPPLHYLPQYTDEITAQGASQLVEIASSIFRKADDGTVLEHLRSLEDLASSMPFFPADEPLDTIYALLSLANDTNAPISFSAATYSATAAGHVPDSTLIQPWTVLPTSESLEARPRKGTKPDFEVDYTKPLSAVMKEFVGFVITKSDSLDIICRPFPLPERPSELPSWVPTFATAAFRPDPSSTMRRVRADPLVGIPSSGVRPYRAAGNTKAEWKFGTGIEENILCVKGFFLDSIEVRADSALEGNIPSEWLTYGGWIDTSKSPPENFWKTLVADRGHEGSSVPGYYRLACQSIFSKRPVGGDLNTQHLVDHRSSTIVQQYLKRVQNVVWKRRLIVTAKQSFLGLAPPEAKENDLVFILFGCSVPVVLRPKYESGDDCYTFIGECYINGVMNGEALKSQEGAQDSRYVKLV